MLADDGVKVFMGESEEIKLSFPVGMIADICEVRYFAHTYCIQQLFLKGLENIYHLQE